MLIFRFFLMTFGTLFSEQYLRIYPDGGSHQMAAGEPSAQPGAVFAFILTPDFCLLTPIFGRGYE
jgi:hypothetical protein